MDFSPRQVPDLERGGEQIKCAIILYWMHNKSRSISRKRSVHEAVSQTQAGHQPMYRVRLLPMERRDGRFGHRQAVKAVRRVPAGLSGSGDRPGGAPAASSFWRRNSTTAPSRPLGPSIDSSSKTSCSARARFGSGATVRLGGTRLADAAAGKGDFMVDRAQGRSRRIGGRGGFTVTVGRRQAGV